MRRRRLYGQHFLISRTLASRIVRAAGIRPDDTVLELGTGRGMLTPLLCSMASRVISVESDVRLYEKAAARLSHDNLTLLCGDGFKVDAVFDVFVSNLPYSRSRQAVEWLAARRFRCGIITVQEEFAQKISETGPDRRAVSVVWREAFEAGDSFPVGRRNFDPPPMVSSTAIPFQKRRVIPPHITHNLHMLFSRRRKLLHTGTGPRRLADLSNREVMEIALSM